MSTIQRISLRCNRCSRKSASTLGASTPSRVGMTRIANCQHCGQFQHTITEARSDPPKQPAQMMRNSARA